MRERAGAHRPGAEPLDAVAEAVPAARRRASTPWSPRSPSTGSTPRRATPRSRASCARAAPWRWSGTGATRASPGCASSRASPTRTPATRRATAAATGAAASTATRPSRRSSGAPGRTAASAGRDVVLARAASMSFVAALDEEPREQPARPSSRELLDTHPGHARPRRRRAPLRDRAVHHAQADDAPERRCRAAPWAARLAVQASRLVPVEVLLELPVVDLLAIVGPFGALLADEGVVDVLAERRCAAPSRPRAP